MTKPILFIIPGACSFGAQVTLELLKITYQVCITTPEIRFSGAFRRINPQGKVGALKDENILIAENIAILLYLSDKYSFGPEINNDNRIKIYQWLSYLSTTLHPAFSQYFYTERFIDIECQANLKSNALKRLHLVLAFINEHLTNKKYFVNDKVSIVDVQAYGLLRWALEARANSKTVGLEKYIHIKSLLNKLDKLQEVKNSLAIEQNKTEQLKDSNFAGYFTL